LQKLLVMDRIFFVASQVVTVHGITNGWRDAEKDCQNNKINDRTKHSIFELEILERNRTGFLH